MQNKQPASNIRLENLRQKLLQTKLDGFLISSPENRYYITGWEGDSESGFVLITADKALILTDSRYTEHAEQLAVGFEIVDITLGFREIFENLSKDYNLKKLGFESHHLSVHLYKRLNKFSPGVKLIGLQNYVEELRAKKDNEEIKNLRKAASITDMAFDYIFKNLQVGLTESEVAWKLTTFMREQGASGNSWEPLIVATGKNSSMAHYGAGEDKIKKGDLVLLDFGCIYQGYHSDMTRVVFIGEPDKRQREIYSLVQKAQEAGIKLVKPGKLGRAIDKKVRSEIAKDTEFFYRHGLGHGVGLNTHELPSLSVRLKQKLDVGNVVTIEPGVYIPGWGGVRLEDMILVTETGSETLTKSPKNIAEVTVKIN